MAAMLGFLPLYTASGIRELERSAPAGAATLMERAGLAAAECAREMCGDTAKSVLVVAGPGNNGGDAFEAAVHLKQWFFRVSLVFAGEKKRLPGDAAAAFARWRKAGGATLDGIPERARFDLVVDGLFGTGLARPLAGAHAALVRAMNELGAPILSLDVPSGLSADTGAVLGCAVRAARTLTFLAQKPGLWTLDGPDHCGEIRLDTLGVDAPARRGPDGHLLDRSVLSDALTSRPRNFHKGQAGSAGILGGATGMVGAAMIAGRAALKCGAGRVYLGLLAPRPPLFDDSQPELMLREPRELLAPGLVDALVAGPGMGKGKAALSALRGALRSPATLLLDADALNLVGGNRTLQAAAQKRKAATIMTPHPGEAARLLGSDTKRVQADRIACAKTLAHRFGSFVVLKGNGSIVAAPDGRWWINPAGNPGMASAGMGDALAGIVAALAAQGAEPLRALLAGVYLHGAAADELVRAGRGPIGITASEVTGQARSLLNEIR